MMKYTEEAGGRVESIEICLCADHDGKRDHGTRMNHGAEICGKGRRNMRVRRSSRAILLNQNSDIFLFKFEFAMLSGHKTLWVTPGGGLENGETFEQALKRELYEELGIVVDADFPVVFYRNKPFTMKNGDLFLSEEKYFLIRLDAPTFSFEHFTENEKRLTRDYKW